MADHSSSDLVLIAGGFPSQLTTADMHCSLAGNLRVTQLVDGNKGIHILLPKACYRERLSLPGRERAQDLASLAWKRK